MVNPLTRPCPHCGAGYWQLCTHTVELPLIGAGRSAGEPPMVRVGDVVVGAFHLSRYGGT